MIQNDNTLCIHYNVKTMNTIVIGNLQTLVTLQIAISAFFRKMGGKLKYQNIQAYKLAVLLHSEDSQIMTILQDSTKAIFSFLIFFIPKLPKIAQTNTDVVRKLDYNKLEKVKSNFIQSKSVYLVRKRKKLNSNFLTFNQLETLFLCFDFLTF